MMHKLFVVYTQARVLPLLPKLKKSFTLLLLSLKKQEREREVDGRMQLGVKTSCVHKKNPGCISIVVVVVVLEHQTRDKARERDLGNYSDEEQHQQVVLKGSMP